MEIVEELDAWREQFAKTWLAHYQETGEVDWKRYNRPRNQTIPGGPGIDLSNSRLLLISTAGGYLPASQTPFDADNDLGDYTIRTFPVETPFDDIAFAHTHYDHTAVNKDPQVLLPLQHLKDLVAEGKIGELASDVISFGGYQPDVARIVEETIPVILGAAKASQARGALLVPA